MTKSVLSYPAIIDRQSGILLTAGLGANEVRTLAADAARLNINLLDHALALQRVDAVALYRAVAAELRMPFRRHDLAVITEGQWQEALQSGIAPLVTDTSGLRFVIAPKGQALQHMLARVHSMEGSGGVMTTPQAFYTAVTDAHKSAITNAASYGLEAKEPRDGFHAVNYRRLLAVILAFVLILSLLVAFAGPVVFRWISLILGFLFLLNVSVRLSAVAAASDISAVDAPPLPDHELPVYSVFVPLYREASVVSALVQALSALDYPRDKLDVQILVEQHDVETRLVLARTTLPDFMRVVVVPEGRPQTKPRALNFGLAFAAGSLCTVYDAEDRPEPDQLRKAAAMFARLPPDYACLQAKLVVDHPDETWITKLFALEYATLFDVIIPGLAAQQLPFGLGGTSNHFRIAHLRAAGGWDAWNVTEDADVGMRLFRKGYRVGALNSVTFEEAPVNLRMWFNQRSRWMKGWLQTSLVHLRAPAALTVWHMPFAWAASVALTYGTVMSALFGPLLMAVIAYELMAGWMDNLDSVLQLLIWTFALTVSLAGIVTVGILGFAGAKRRNLMRLAPWIFLYPFYYLMMTVAAWRAVKDFVWQPYHWRKTEHGLARQRRATPAMAQTFLPPKGTSPVLRWQAQETRRLRG